MFSQNLKDVLADLIPEQQQIVKDFRGRHGSTKVGEVTVDMVSLAYPLNFLISTPPLTSLFVNSIDVWRHAWHQRSGN